jgi:phage terminase small subunit
VAYLQGDAVSKSGKGRKLTPKMLSFINAYFGEANFNATKAYMLSDYASTANSTIASVSAQELMKHPLVKAEVERRLQARTDMVERVAEIKAEYLINKLINIIDNIDEEKTSDRLRAIELAGKAIALWKERQEVSGPNGEAIQHEQHIKESVADFTSRISSLAKRAGTDNVVEFPNSGGTGGA